MCNNSDIMFSDRVFGFKSLFHNNTKQEHKQHDEVTRTEVRKTKLQHYNGVLYEKFKSISVLLKFFPNIVF